MARMTNGTNENGGAAARRAEADERAMRRALEEARKAAEEGEVPVGAVVVDGTGKRIASACNQTRTLCDPTAHAEILAIGAAAGVKGDWRLDDCTLYVTLEPCPMCAGACVTARVGRVVWAADDPLRGGARSRFRILETAELNHHPEIATGVLAEEASEMLKDFFKTRRAENRAARKGEGNG